MEGSEKREDPRLSKTQRQWLWFVGLAAGGLAATALTAYGVRLLLGMES